MMSFKEIIQTLGILESSESSRRLAQMMGQFRDAREFLPEAFDILIKNRKEKKHD